MRRRQFVLLGAAASVAWPGTARSEEPAPLLAVVSIAGREATLQSSWYRAFHERLIDLGWAPDRNLRIEYLFGDEQRDRLSDSLEKLVHAKPNVIFVPTRPALPAVRTATDNIPIVFVSLGDPVAEGWVSSLARPGGNLTGVAGLSPELAGKRVELLHELMPSLSKVAVLRNPANSSEVVAAEATRMAAQSLGISFLAEQATAPVDFERAIDAIKSSGANAVIVLPDPMFFTNRGQLTRLLGQAGLPSIYMETGFVAAGGLISYGPNFTQLFRRAATYVDKILKGAKPADLPVEQPNKFELIINGNTAKTLGLVIPQSILLRADEVIE